MKATFIRLKSSIGVLSNYKIYCDGECMLTLLSGETKSIEISRDSKVEIIFGKFIKNISFNAEFDCDFTVLLQVKPALVSKREVSAIIVKSSDLLMVI